MAETPLCTDEDIAIWDQGDFSSLAPKSQVLASGIDGVIADTSPWVLASTSVDFEANGVASGHVVILTRPAASFRVPGGDLYGVVSVDGGDITLRRLGLAAGVGQPPATADTDDIMFEVRTFGPQIALSSADVRRAYMLGYSGRNLSDLQEAGEELRQTATLHTLRRAYLTSQKAKDSDYQIKLNLVSEALADLTSRLSLQWGAVDSATQPPTNRFSTRISR